jgi:hypothetical protein
VFKRLKRIEALLEQFLEYEKKCLEIVVHRDLEYRRPWKCPHPECTIEQPHWHTVVMAAPTAEVKP